MEERETRQYWMAALAKAPPTALEKAWEKLERKPVYRFIRQPEQGLAMIRARAGNTGVMFNLGEMTITRSTVELESGRVGLAYVAGRSLRHAELAAVFDAMLQDESSRDTLMKLVVEPLVTERMERKKKDRAKVETSRVNFFTMVRGDD